MFNALNDSYYFNYFELNKLIIFFRSVKQFTEKQNELNLDSRNDVIRFWFKIFIDMIYHYRETHFFKRVLMYNYLLKLKCIKNVKIWKICFKSWKMIIFFLINSYIMSLVLRFRENSFKFFNSFLIKAVLRFCNDFARWAYLNIKNHNHSIMLKKISKFRNERKKKSDVMMIIFSFDVKKFKELTRYFNKTMKK